MKSPIGSDSNLNLYTKNNTNLIHLTRTQSHNRLSSSYFSWNFVVHVSRSRVQLFKVPYACRRFRLLFVVDAFHVVKPYKANEMKSVENAWQKSRCCGRKFFVKMMSIQQCVFYLFFSDFNYTHNLSFRLFSK